MSGFGGSNNFSLIGSDDFLLRIGIVFYPCFLPLNSPKLMSSFKNKGELLKYILLILVAIILPSCATTASVMNKISIGMTKTQVIDTIGEPDGISAIDNIEYMNYYFFPTREAARRKIEVPYFVRILDGVVESYGRKGDFDSTEGIKNRLEMTIKTKEEKE